MDGEYSFTDEALNRAVVEDSTSFDELNEQAQTLQLDSEEHLFADDLDQAIDFEGESEGSDAFLDAQDHEDDVGELEEDEEDGEEEGEEEEDEVQAGNTEQPTSDVYTVHSDNPPDHYNSALQEVGSHASWLLSTAKLGNGVKQLRDNNAQTYWQSDGVQPHSITLQFHKKTNLHSVALHLDVTADESYTPQKISIQCGTTIDRVHNVKVIEVVNPAGWVCVPLGPVGGRCPYLRTYVLRIVILTNHQNGRDSHVRQVRVYGTNRSRGQDIPLDLSTVDFQQFESLR